MVVRVVVRVGLIRTAWDAAPGTLSPPRILGRGNRPRPGGHNAQYILRFVGARRSHPCLFVLTTFPKVLMKLCEINVTPGIFSLGGLPVYDTTYFEIFFTC